MKYHDSIPEGAVFCTVCLVSIRKGSEKEHEKQNPKRHKETK